MDEILFTNFFLTRKWWTPREATWGECVTTKTCLFFPNFFNLSPTAVETAPPIPLSTSSNTIVETLSCSAVTFIARAILQSSPPDEMLLISPILDFGLVLI